MIINVDKRSCVVFDLDDTLYSEIEYLKSAYRAISSEISDGADQRLYDKMLEIFFSGGNAFGFLIEKYCEKNLTLEKLLYLYRNHFPEITLREGAMELLAAIKNINARTGIITDGRSVTQRNKIKALGIEKYIDEIIISEEFGAQKPSKELFELFMNGGNSDKYYYFGDNLDKDFIAPKKLNWACIGITNSHNIRKQDIAGYPDEYLPDIFIKDFKEIGII